MRVDGSSSDSPPGGRGVAEHRAVAVDHALGLAGRAGRVAHELHVGRGDVLAQAVDHRHERRIGDGVVGPRASPRPARLTAEQDHPQLGERGQQQPSASVLGQLVVGQFGCDLLEPGDVVVTEERRHADQDLHVRVAEEPAQFGCLEEGVHRHGHRADPGHGRPRHDPVDAVREQQANTAALGHADAHQLGGEAGRAVVELGVGQALGRRGHADRVWPARPSGAQQLGNGGRAGYHGGSDTISCGGSR